METVIEVVFIILGVAWAFEAIMGGIKKISDISINLFGKKFLKNLVPMYQNLVDAVMKQFRSLDDKDDDDDDEGPDEGPNDFKFGGF